MSKKWKDIFPAILGLLCLLIIEIINVTGIVMQSQRENFQTISNILLLIIGAYSLFCVVMQMKKSGDGVQIHFLNNLMIVVSAYVLNIDIFENKIQDPSQLLTGWHVLWTLWTVAMILWFSGMGKRIYELETKVFQYLIGTTADIAGWIESTVRASNKGVLFYIVGGIVFCQAFLAVGYILGWFSGQEIPRQSLFFWGIWTMIYILGSFFASFYPRIRQLPEEIGIVKIFKYFMMSVIVVIILFVTIQVFPSLFQVVGTILSGLMLAFLLLVAVFLTGKRILSKFKILCWKDICFLLSIVIIVTFVLIPLLGATTLSGKNVLNSQSIENLTKFVELFTAGLEFVKALI